MVGGRYRRDLIAAARGRDLTAKPNLTAGR